MARRVKHSIDHYRVADHSEYDSVRKSVRVDPTNLKSAVTHAVQKWVTRKTDHLRPHGSEKLSAQAGLLPFVPGFGLQQVVIHFRTDQELVAHSPSLRLRRASNCSQGMAVAGSFS